MAFLFPQKRTKTINELIFALNQWVLRIDVSTPDEAAVQTRARAPRQLSDQQRQAADECNRLLAQIRSMMSMYDQEDAPGSEVDFLTGMAKEIYNTNVLLPLVAHLDALDFEARRDVANMFALLVQRPPTIDYLLENIPEIFNLLIDNAGKPETHRPVGNMLRDCTKHEALLSHILNLKSFWFFFQYMNDPEFEVATDNFSTFQECMRRFPHVTARFLKTHAELFSSCINSVIRSDNYVAKRQTLRILALLLRSSLNQDFIWYYAGDIENLKLVMRLLKDKSKNINMEALSVFSVFVANPLKPAPILEVLIRNKSKLLDMIDNKYSVAERREDKTYREELHYVRNKISNVPDPLPRAARAGSVGQLAGDPMGPQPAGRNNAQPPLNHSSSQLAPQFVPQPSQLPPQVTAPQLVHRPSSPSRAQVSPDALNQEMARHRLQ